MTQYRLLHQDAFITYWSVCFELQTLKCSTGEGDICMHCSPNQSLNPVATGRASCSVFLTAAL